MAPSITVTIGHETRIYFAYVTTAPPALDSPATVTLYEGPFWDVVGLARDPVTHDEFRGRMPARLVLVEEMQREMPARWPHDSLNSLVGVNRSPQRRAFQEVTL